VPQIFTPQLEQLVEQAREIRVIAVGHRDFNLTIDREAAPLEHAPIKHAGRFAVQRGARCTGDRMIAVEERHNTPVRTTWFGHTALSICSKPLATPR
jgi:hypothetical protein